MVTPGGFEPSIFILGGCCIIQLCYGAIYIFIVVFIVSRKFHEDPMFRKWRILRKAHSISVCGFSYFCRTSL